MKKSNVGTRNDIVEKLKNAIMDADFDSAPKLTEEALKAGVEPEVIMEKAISEGMDELEEELFHGYKVWGHPILFMAVEAARRSLLVLESCFKPGEERILGTVVLGTPAGDVHDMGGKMLALNLTAAGFKVVYLGRDVPPSLFVHKVKESNAQILAISSYQTNSYERIKEILDLLSEAGLRDKVKVMAGGCAITEKLTTKFGIGYAKTASDGVKLAKKYIGGK
jgi:methylmalonyl-CoA mutase cobalamin-binding domain/chain